MILLRGRLRSTMTAQESAVSAPPRWPTVSTASTRRWNLAGKLGGTLQIYWPMFSWPSMIGCQIDPAWSGRQNSETERGGEVSRWLAR